MTVCGLNTSVIGEDLPQYFRAKGEADSADHDEHLSGCPDSTPSDAAGKLGTYAG
jgi:hypothetical protein